MASSASLPTAGRFGSMLLALASACHEPTVPARAQSAPASGAVIAPTSGDGSGVGDDGHPFDNDVSSVVGQPAPAWALATWFNSAPLALEQLRGRAVFVRWFMGPTCPLCNASAPSLRKLDETYGARGLVVVGMYHHKDPDQLDPRTVAGYVQQKAFTFPVAIDEDWRTLNRWWLDGHPRRKFTSVSFLLDKQGIVRHVHLGGRLEPTSAAYAAIARAVDTLLDEPRARERELR